MQKIKSNIHLVISCILLTLISSLNIFINLAAGKSFARPITAVLIGTLLIIGISFLKEKHLYDFSLILYLAVLVLLIIPLFADSTPFNRFIVIGSVALLTSATVPLAFMQVSKTITRYRAVTTERFIAICFLSALPTFILLLQYNHTFMILSLMVIFVTTIILKKENRIKIPWRVFIIIAILAIIYLIAIYSDGGYISQRMDVIFTRGMCDPYGAGWVRTVCDKLFKSAKIIGSSSYMVGKASIIETLYNFADCDIAIILAKYGWLAFFGTLALYAEFFICLFKMISKTRQSSFAKYTSLISGLYLLCQTLYSLIGLFLLEKAPMNLSFIDGFTCTTVDFVLFGIICTLYLQRNEPSEVEEYDCDDRKSIIHLLREKLYSFLYLNNDFDVNYDEDLEDDEFWEIYKNKNDEPTE